jgi:hypothetical protein
MHRRNRLAAAILASIGLTATGPSLAASHREAPGVAADPTADITDVYAFVSYDTARTMDQRRVTFIMNVIPGQNPADGPNYFNFGDDVVYRINIDNDRDGKADDVIYEFRFKTQNRPIDAAGGLTSPVPYLGNPYIPNALPLQGITSLDGKGSEGLTRRQVYSVTEIRGGRRTELFGGKTLVAVPSNAGSATMPNYEALAAQGIYSKGGKCGDGIEGVRVFAGQRAETFYIDLGAVFDTLNLRKYPPLLTPAQNADRVNSFGKNRFANTNVNTIAIEVPIKCVTSDAKPPDGKGELWTNALIGVYASTSRHKDKAHHSTWNDSGWAQRSRWDGADEGRLIHANWGGGDKATLVQVARMGNPLVNELIINTPEKDKWNATEPEDEAQFQRFYQDPFIATAFELVYKFPVLPFNGSPKNKRTDLMIILLKYPGQPLGAKNNCGHPCSELLRLNMNVAPTAPEFQKRLGSVLGGDPAGWPNGRRPNDDVTDIAIRVVGGTNYIDNLAGDGVNFLDGAPGAGPGPKAPVTENGIAKEFPFLPTPYSGRKGVAK